MNHKVRGYVFSRPFMGERVPQHVQNLVIRDYCEKNSLHFLLSASEYAMDDCHLMLSLVLEELNKIDGIALYSLFQLPKEIKKRNEIYNTVLEQKKAIYFCVEGLKLTSKEERDRVENLWLVKSAMLN
tara:strand:+ start:166 stop:549 length:384 start_codon:yes stop_codon:yes gene_type:complete